MSDSIQEMQAQKTALDRVIYTERQSQCPHHWDVSIRTSSSHADFEDGVEKSVVNRFTITCDTCKTTWDVRTPAKASPDWPEVLRLFLDSLCGNRVSTVGSRQRPPHLWG